MTAIRCLQPGEALPEGHVCLCVECGAGRLPPELPENPEPWDPPTLEQWDDPLWEPAPPDPAQLAAWQAVEDAIFQQIEDEVLRGHFRAGGPILLAEHVRVNDAPSLLVMQCQTGDVAHGEEPWVLELVEPLHRCRGRGHGGGLGDRPCVSWRFVRRVAVDIYAPHRPLYERMLGRAASRAVAAQAQEFAQQQQGQ